MAEKSPSHEQVEADNRKRMRLRNAKIAALRERSGLSMDDLAKLMGFKGQSSIQRYLGPDYDKGFRPELALKFQAALLGRGNPPITPTELEVFDQWVEGADGSTINVMDQVVKRKLGNEFLDYYERLKVEGFIHDSLLINNMSRAGHLMPADTNDERTAGLPLSEGDVIVRMPKRLSAESASTLRDWLTHLINLAESEGKSHEK